MADFEVDKSKIVTFTYLNWKGEIGIRVAQPIELYFAATPHHPEPTWLIRTWDIEKSDYRSFALKDILTPIKLTNRPPGT